MNRATRAGRQRWTPVRSAPILGHPSPRRSMRPGWGPRTVLWPEPGRRQARVPRESSPAPPPRGAKTRRGVPPHAGRTVPSSGPPLQRLGEQEGALPPGKLSVGLGKVNLQALPSGVGNETGWTRNLRQAPHVRVARTIDDMAWHGCHERNLAQRETSPLATDRNIMTRPDVPADKAGSTPTQPVFQGSDAGSDRPRAPRNETRCA